LGRADKKFFWRGLIDDFGTMDWVEDWEGLKYSRSKNIEKYISFKE
jgi:hypothetical protein